VTDQSLIDRREIVEQADGWLRFDYGKYSREWAYSQIKPQLIIEEFIQSGARSRDGVPWDYKFSVFDGKCRMIQVEVDRFCGHTSTLFTRDWEVIPAEFTYPRAAVEPGRPEQLEQMLQVAEVAGEDIDFVRVDIYDSVRGPIIGEMTCFPEGGTGKFAPLYYDHWLGSFWNFNPKD
jgi:hypothetical protein